MSCYTWNTYEYSEESFRCLVAAGIPPLPAALLCSRGYDAEAAQAMLSDSEAQLCNPLLMRDMTAAVDRIRLALRRREHIAVYGDYDVDGITSVYLLTSWLRSHGADCEGYIPNRISEGYGLNSAAVELLHDRGAALLVTVDCGITAVAETELAVSLGMDVIITDHHECQAELPRALAVVNPCRADCPYPNKNLAGVGVAFKLVCALDGSPDSVLERYSDIAAIGTVADVMQLVGENRFLVRHGIAKLSRRPSAGLRALMYEAGIEPAKITASSISFILAPRINAAGRMGEAETALKLLYSSTEAEAHRLAVRLCTLNRSRQSLENSIYEEALSRLGDDAMGQPVILASPDWHQGVAGIVASRLAEHFCAPAIVICLDGGRGKGSCRSFGSFNLFDALDTLSEYLDGFGGHAFAAGLTVTEENIEPFRRAFIEYYDRAVGDNMPFPSLNLDFTVKIPELLTLDAVDSLTALEPFGNGNERPQLALSDVRLDRLVPIGGGKHLRAVVSKFGCSYDCICFSRTAADFGVNVGDTVELAFSPQVNEYRGSRTVQLLLLDMRPSVSSYEKELSELDIYDRWTAGKALSASELKSLTPERKDLALIWRRLSAPEFSVGGRRDMLLNTLRPDLSPHRALICLDVFNELGLIKLYSSRGMLRVHINDNLGKVNLNDSDILRRLKEADAESERR